MYEMRACLKIVLFSLVPQYALPCGSVPLNYLNGPAHSTWSLQSFDLVTSLRFERPWNLFHPLRYMDTVKSEDVQHGTHSWVDHDRPYILRTLGNELS